MRRVHNPAIVLNPGAAGIGVIHALALAGIDVFTIARAWPPLVSRFSRFPVQRAWYDPQRGETMIDGLVTLAGTFDGTGILFPSTDLDLEALILGRDRLEDRYHVPAARAIGLRIFEKNWQYEMAERAGVPVPAHVRFRGGEAPDVHGLRFPLIVKPSTRAATAGDWVFRLRIVDTPDALAACLEEIAREHAGRDFQVAENIPGEPDQIYTVGTYSGRDGRVQRCYTGRKLSQYPYHHGVASLAESVTLPAAATAQAEALLNAMGFEGISQVEYKYDPRDGQYKLLEVNGRAWLWIKLAAYSGVNLPAIQYFDLTGDPRLAAALASPQRDDRFYRHSLHVWLNRNPVERRRLQEIARVKQRVDAVPLPGDPLLTLAYHLGSLARWARARLRPGAAPLGSTWAPSRRTDLARASVQAGARPETPVPLGAEDRP